MDTIADFTLGTDILEIRDNIFVDTTAAVNAATYANGDAAINLGSGNSVLLVGITSGLAESDFSVS